MIFLRFLVEKGSQPSIWASVESRRPPSSHMSRNKGAPRSTALVQKLGTVSSNIFNHKMTVYISKNK